MFFRWSAYAIAFVECGCLKLLEDFLKLRGNHFLLKVFFLIESGNISCGVFCELRGDEGGIVVC